MTYYAKQTHINKTGKTMKNKDYEALTATLERKETLESELKTKQLRFDLLVSKKELFTCELVETKNEINGYSDKGRGISPDNLSKFKTCQEKANRIESELTQAKVETDELNKDIVAISAELSKVQYGTKLETVLEHQKAIDIEQKELDKFQILIEDQHSKISASCIKEDKVSPLIRLREELLADIAIGKAPYDNLGKLDVEIEKERKEQEDKQFHSSKIIIDGQNTIAGLERRKEIIVSRIAELNHLTPGVLDYLVMWMAQQAAEEFNRIAKDMEKKLTELAALDTLVAEFGKRRNTGLFPKDWWSARIPNIGNISPCARLSGDANHYINTDNSKINVKDYVYQLKQNIINLGIKI